VYLAYEVLNLTQPLSDRERNLLLSVTEQYYDTSFRLDLYNTEYLFQEFKMEYISEWYNKGIPQPRYNFLLKFNARISYESGSARSRSVANHFAAMSQIQSDFRTYDIGYLLEVESLASTVDVVLGNGSALSDKDTDFDTFVNKTLVPPKYWKFFDDAVSRWTSVITGDIGSRMLTEGDVAGAECEGLQAGQTINDVYICADVEHNDGPGKIGGHARPTVRAQVGDHFLPVVGEMA